MNARHLPAHDVGWKHNLSKPNDPIPNTPHVLLLSVTTHNDVYIEIPRSTSQARGIALCGAIAFISYFIFAVCPIFYQIIMSGQHIRTDIILTFTIIIPLAAYSFSPLVKMDLTLPCDEPIRFNRARQKVYFYQYRYSLLNVFSRSLWGVVPIAYNWKDLTAEAYSFYAPMGNGGLIESIRISVQDPETGKVIDRLFFSSGIQRGTEQWEAVRRFMNHQDERLIEYHLILKEQINPLKRLAPRVEWPTAMDLESRTTPIPEDQL